MAPLLWHAVTRMSDCGITFAPQTAHAAMVQRAVTDASTGGPPYINGPNGRELHAVDAEEAELILHTLMDSYVERYGHVVDLQAGGLVAGKGDPQDALASAADTPTAGEGD